MTFMIADSKFSCIGSRLLVTSVASVVILPPTHLAMSGRSLAGFFLQHTAQYDGARLFCSRRCFPYNILEFGGGGTIYLFPHRSILIHRVAKARISMPAFLGAAMSLASPNFG